MYQVRFLILFCFLQKEFSFFFCNTGMTSKMTTLCALRRPWAQTKEPTPALLRIELEKWKLLLPSLCEVSLPTGRGSVSCRNKLLSDEIVCILAWCLGFTYPLQFWMLFFFTTEVKSWSCCYLRQNFNWCQQDKMSLRLKTCSGSFFIQECMHICLNMDIDFNMWAIS